MSEQTYAEVLRRVKTKSSGRSRSCINVTSNIKIAGDMKENEIALKVVGVHSGG